ncbi:MAG: glycerol-3-phosphate acyltransferase [Dehalococcoidales bacterium]|nr:MAG: glycerol-3-phosphate acyltransferase [Dehalococcoidales bacterium]
MAWLVVLLGYLVGSIPTAYIAGRLLGAGDIRCLGDGNVGARNAYHQLGSKVGIVIFFIDITKGVLPVLLVRAVGLPDVVFLVTGMATVIGHNWPVFLGLRGGRGESTTIGVLLALVTQPMLILAGPALATLLIKRNVIIASCVLFIPLPLVCWWLGLSGILVGYSVALPCLVGATHYLRTRQVSDVSAAGVT